MVAEANFLQEKKPTKAEEREKMLVKYAGRWRCEKCHGTWDTHQQAIDHFEAHEDDPGA